MVPVLVTLISSYEICLATQVLYIVLFATGSGLESRGQDNEWKLFLTFYSQYLIFIVNFEIAKFWKEASFKITVFTAITFVGT
jgi:hypothetical protein